MDEGVSAGKALAARPQGALLLAALQGKHKAAHVVAVKLDRLFRNASDCLTTVDDWDHCGVALHLLDLGGQSVNTKTAMGRMMLVMAAGFAEMERNLIRERTSMALSHKKARREAYAPTPFGFDRQGKALIPCQSEAEAVRHMVTLRSEGLSYDRIAARLNEAQVPTKRGGLWHGCTVRYILLNTLHEAS
jgi:DNA invertase Pin-like site-specific DNA recombinase